MFSDSYQWNCHVSLEFGAIRIIYFDITLSHNSILTESIYVYMYVWIDTFILHYLMI